jgi:signal transduction histidine kinase
MGYPTSRKVLPVLVFIFFGCGALALWQNQVDHEREIVLRHAETSAQQFRIRVEGLMSARIASLKLIADRWVEREPPDFSEQRFYGFADILFRHYEGFAEIHWIDPAGSVRWTFPVHSDTSWRSTKTVHHPDSHYHVGLLQAGATPSGAVTSCTEFKDGKMGFHILVPLVWGEKLQGFLDGVFLLTQIMEMSVPPGISEDFSIRLYEDNRLIYTGGEPGDMKPGVKPNSVRQDVHFADRHWQVELEPNAAFYGNASGRHRNVLAFGLALSAVLSLLFYALLRRMELYRESRDQALREVTERQRVEAVLRDKEKQQEALLAELSAKNAELGTFVYTVSHDLKTPIVTIEGFIGALREDFADRLSETGEKYLGYMSEAARKMEVLINDLLNLSRIGRLAEVKTEFPLGDLLHEVMEALRPQMEARGIEVLIQPQLPVVYGERKRISQAVDNLLNNSVKYIGKDNPSPRIEVGCLDQDGQAVFFVRDNGIGIEDRYFDKIFNIFERLPAAKREGEGTGIGLTIVKRIVELHGGRIWLDSEPGKGTTFFFTLGNKDTLSHAL